MSDKYKKIDSTKRNSVKDQNFGIPYSAEVLNLYELARSPLKQEHESAHKHKSVKKK